LLQQKYNFINNKRLHKRFLKNNITQKSGATSCSGNTVVQPLIVSLLKFNFIALKKAKY